ncbi:MAG TPA: hypothetical protein VLG74_06620 [Blastocatellia bacterium]|nr:hypothetical protein [Blastocatellia bacterium]
MNKATHGTKLSCHSPGQVLTSDLKKALSLTIAEGHAIQIAPKILFQITGTRFINVRFQEFNSGFDTADIAGL